MTEIIGNEPESQTLESLLENGSITQEQYELFCAVKKGIEDGFRRAGELIEGKLNEWMKKMDEMSERIEKRNQETMKIQEQTSAKIREMTARIRAKLESKNEKEAI